LEEQPDGWISADLTEEMKYLTSSYLVRGKLNKSDEGFTSLWREFKELEPGILMLRDLSRGVFSSLEGNNTFDVDWIVPAIAGHDADNCPLQHLWYKKGKAPVHKGAPIKKHDGHSEAMAALCLIQEAVAHNLHLAGDYLYVPRLTLMQIGLMAQQERRGEDNL
jgi:hypothetical protein